MSHKVLIVDDSDIVLSLHAYILEGAGFRCSCAKNGYLALEMLLREPFHLVVTDVNMPRMDGYAFTRQLRATDGCRDVPVIMISTEEEAADRIKGLEAGANVYLVKPTQPAELVTKVQMLLA